METKFTFGTVLDIFFSHMTAGASVLADHYVHRDRTLVYKWRHDKAFPSRPLFPDIIRFAMDKSSEATRPIIRGRIDACIRSSALPSAQKQELIGQEAFPDYLLNVINVLAVLWKNDKGGAADEYRIFVAENTSAIPYPSATEGQYAPSQAGTAVMENAVAALPASEPPRPANPAMHTTLSDTTLLNILLAAAACLAGDGLWAALAWALRWPGDAWMQGGGLPAFLWGLLFTFPVVALVMVSLRGAAPRETGKGGRLLPAGGFTAAGGVAALLLTAAAPGGLLGGQAASVANEIFLVFISALVMTFLPTLILLALLRFPKVGTVSFLLMEFGPALLCVLSALPAIFAGAWPGGAFWLGGFLPAAVAKLAMYLAVWRILRGCPNKNKII